MKKIVRPDYLKKTGLNILNGDSMEAPSIQNNARIEKYQHFGNKKLFPQPSGSIISL